MSNDTEAQEVEQLEAEGGDTTIGEVIAESVFALVQLSLEQHQSALREIIREEVAKLLDVEETAVALCLRELHAGMDKRLGEIEKACGLIVDHATFMEKALIRVTECAQRPNSEEAEEWRQSLADDPPSDCEFR